MPILDVLLGLSVAEERDSSVKQSQFNQTAFSCAPTQRPEILENMNIYDAKGGSSGVDRSYTHMPRSDSQQQSCDEQKPNSQDFWGFGWVSAHKNPRCVFAIVFFLPESFSNCLFLSYLGIFVINCRT